MLRVQTTHLLRFLATPPCSVNHVVPTAAQRQLLAFLTVEAAVETAAAAVPLLDVLDLQPVQAGAGAAAAQQPQFRSPAKLTF